MKLTKRQLIRLIKEAMYDPRTLPKDHIPKSMIAMEDEYKDVIHQVSSTGEESYNQAAMLAEPPAVIDMAGGYQGGLKKADRMKTRALFNDIKHFIHNIYSTLPKVQKPYHDLIKLQYSRGTLMTQDDIIDTIINISPETFFEGMWYHYLTDQGHEDPIYDDSNNYKKYDDYLKLTEQELRKFYTPEKIQQIAQGK